MMQMLAPPLPSLSINASELTISGISSGADFAVQFHVAFSATVKGVGVFAGQPYHCAVQRFDGDPLVPSNATQPGPVPVCDGCPPNMTLTYDHCKKWGEIVQPTLLQDYAEARAAAGQIDDPSNLHGQAVYLYRGTLDSCYLPGAEGAVINFYKKFVGSTGGNFAFESTVRSKHAQPTIHAGSPCSGPYDGPYSYLASCDYDGAGAALQHLYRHALAKPSTSADLSRLIPFSQAAFALTDVGLADTGHLFLPPACAEKNARCKLHVWFHGCGGPDRFYNASIHYAGFNEWAETNNMVILYPAMRQWGTTHQTQSGCWDAYAQTGADYALQSGGQMAAVRRMLKALAGV